MKATKMAAMLGALFVFAGAGLFAQSLSGKFDALNQSYDESINFKSASAVVTNWGNKETVKYTVDEAKKEITFEKDAIHGKKWIYGISGWWIKSVDDNTVYYSESDIKEVDVSFIIGKSFGGGSDTLTFKKDHVVETGGENLAYAVDPDVKMIVVFGDEGYWFTYEIDKKGKVTLYQDGDKKSAIKEASKLGSFLNKLGE